MTKKYLSSHPHLDFSIDARKADIETWMLLGEAQSKCEHIAGSLLDPGTAEELHAIYLAKGALATTAIEGNTLTEEQVLKHIAGKLELPKSKEYLQQEVDNIIKACNEIVKSHLQGFVPSLSVQEIREYNVAVLKDLQLADDVIPGEMRLYNVTVGRYLGAPAEDCEYLLEKMCQMLEGDFSLGKDWPIASGILKAILAHLYIAWIHPFGDGNGRTARLVEFKLCIASGIPTPASHLLSNHYNETRSRYYLALERTSKERDPFPFIKYALQGYVDQLEEQIKIIKQTQNKAFWTNFIYETFKNMNGVANKRQRHLVLDISDYLFRNKKEWINISDIEMTSSRLREDYAGKIKRTKMRDIEDLLGMKLIVREGAEIRPYIERIYAYLPRKL